PDDGRSLQVALSPRGKKVVDALVGPHLAVERRLLSALSAPEQRTLTRLLRKLTHSREAGAP
ncbi:MAG TPA: hypothetical protein PK954_26555, partial [Anaerolineales bacterium]|nr:hypothetical protein [Anaerolineales bacterium]